MRKGSAVRNKIAFLAVALTIVGMNTLAFPQADWTQKLPAHVPSKRMNTSMAQYGSGGTVVMFGGLNLGPVITTPTGASFPVYNQHNVLGDTWIWNGSDWSLFTTTLATPAARYGASMAYDPVTGQAVLFGGQDASGNYLSDTWTFSFTSFCIGTTCRTLGPFWNQLTGTAPPARAGASMAYDPDLHGIVLTGGSNAAGSFSDTWQLNSSTHTWTNATPAFKVTPARPNAAMAQCNRGVAGDNRVMLFGGGLPFSGLNDSWAFGPYTEGVGIFWGTLSPATKPLARTFAPMAYYPVSSQDVLYGGEFFVQEIGLIVLQDTWNGNCISPGSWTQATPVHSPGPRFAQAMTTGPNGLTVVLFGGSDVIPGGSFPNGRDHSDTWTWGRRVACVPVDGSQIAEDSKVTCRFEPAAGLRFDGWRATGFDQEFRRKIDSTFSADDAGPASITAQWTDADGLHSQTLNYQVVGREH